MGSWSMFSDIGKVLDESFLRPFPELEGMAKEEGCSITQCVMNIVEREVRKRKSLGELSETGNVFQFIKDNTDIVKTINGYVEVDTYKKSYCPFHEPRNEYSLIVSPNKKIFYCSTCHMGGDVTSFVCRFLNISPRQAALLLIKKYNLDVPREYINQLEEIPNK